MDILLFGSGVITDASSDFSVVRVKFKNDKLYLFSFSKEMLYFSGTKCEGHMNSVLEPGMEVNVLCTGSSIRNPYISAVWLGSRPDIEDVQNAICMDPIFDDEGCLIKVNDEHVFSKCDDFVENAVAEISVVYRDGCSLDWEARFGKLYVCEVHGIGIDARDGLLSSYANEVVHSTDCEANSPEFTESSKALFNENPLSGFMEMLWVDCAFISFRNLTIHVNMSDVYVDGSLCSPQKFDELSEDKSAVHFEATWIPRGLKSKYGPGITHLASCVWTGEKPSLSVVTSTLDPPDFSLLEDENRTYIGYVIKFYLPKIALYYLKREKTIVTLHLSEIGRTIGEEYILNASITDFVFLGEYSKFKLRRWNEFLTAFDREPSSKHAFKKLMRMQNKACNELSSTVHASVDTSLSANTGPGSSKRKVMLEGFGAYSGVFSLDKVPNVTERLLYCQGSLTKTTSFREDGGIRECFTVEHRLGSSSFMDTPFVYGANGNKPIIPETFRACSSLEICFDAVVIDTANDKLHFYVERMWIKEFGRQPPEVFLSKDLFNAGEEALSPGRLYRGTVMSIPLNDCAIALVSSVPVLVTLKALVTKKKFNHSYTSIDVFLKVNDEVLLAAKPVKAGNYYRATQLWSVKADETDKTDGNETKKEIASKAISLLYIEYWKSDEYYGRGPVGRQLGTGRYFVKFKTPKRKISQTILLDLFANNRVFVNGKFIGLSEAHILVGREISFYVGYSPEKEEKGITPFGLYVEYAWTGNGPLPWAALDDRLSVPKGVVCSNWMFEAVVECLPIRILGRGVPRHMVCSIGPLLVVIPFSSYDVAQKTLEKGDIVSLRVREEAHETKTGLVSNNIEGVLCGRDVIRLKGKVAASPNPVGIIKTVNDFEVIFDMCCVKDKAEFEFNDKERSAWFDRVKRKVSVGATVYFTAVMNANGTPPDLCRAFDVWVPES